MSIEKMALVHIMGKEKSLNQALLLCVQSELFHPENVFLKPEEEIFERKSSPNPYNDIYQKIEDILEILQIPKTYNKDVQTKAFSLDEAEDTIDALHATAIEMAKRQKKLQEDVQLQEQTLLQIKHMIGLGAPIEDIFTSNHSVARFGRLPVDNLVKLDYFKDKEFFFYPFDKDRDYAWGIYITPQHNAKEIDDIFSSLYFEIIELPDSLYGTPENAVKLLSNQIRESYTELHVMDAEFGKEKFENQEMLQNLYSQVKTLHDTFLFRKYAVIGRKKFRLIGFVPESELDSFLNMFDEYDSIVCETQPADVDEHYTPPIKLKTNWLFRPFEMYVETYGLPSYKDINPTTYIGIIYVLLFGIMFADLGQGFCVVLAGILIWKLKKMKLGLILSRCGFASMFFGFLNGSVFGFEDNFQNVFKALGLWPTFPIDVLDSKMSLILLLLSLGVGICIILASMIVNIFIGLRRKDLGSALFSSNGIAGLVFYGGIVAAALLLLIFNVNVFQPAFFILVILLPLVLIFLHEPLGNFISRHRHSREEKEKFSVMDSVFEMVDVLLSYCTNTLSFLRVGGFILSHAALMLVVMQFAHMASSFGSPIVVVLGNIFVMALEGLVVSIQVLRLVYYETFSRFYISDGKPFVPAKIEAEEANKK